MKKLLKRSAVFCIPVLVWLGVVVALDPFNYFDVSPLIPERIKQLNAQKLNRLMYNMIDYHRRPAANLLIGDSRSNNLSIELIERTTGDDWFLLNSNALKLNESFELYWFACGLRRPDRVYFTLNFNMFNKFAFADRVGSVERILTNPLLYVFDRNVAETCWLVSKSYLSRREAVSSVPPMTRDAFWDWIVRVKGSDYYGKFEYPGDVYEEMKKVVGHASENGTEIVFIIVPHHADMQRRVADFGLTGELSRFKRDLFELGVPVYDYDYANAITRDRDNFDDPIHYNMNVGDRMVGEIWGGENGIGRLMTREYADSLPAGETAGSAKPTATAAREPARAEIQ